MYRLLTWTWVDDDHIFIWVPTFPLSRLPLDTAYVLGTLWLVSWNEVLLTLDLPLAPPPQYYITQGHLHSFHSFCGTINCLFSSFLFKHTVRVLSRRYCFRFFTFLRRHSHKIKLPSRNLRLVSDKIMTQAWIRWRALCFESDKCICPVVRHIFKGPICWESWFLSVIANLSHTVSLWQKSAFPPHRTFKAGVTHVTSCRFRTVFFLDMWQQEKAHVQITQRWWLNVI